LAKDNPKKKKKEHHQKKQSLWTTWTIEKKKRILSLFCFALFRNISSFSLLWSWSCCSLFLSHIATSFLSIKLFLKIIFPSFPTQKEAHQSSPTHLKQTNFRKELFPLKMSNFNCSMMIIIVIIALSSSLLSSVLCQDDKYCGRPCPDNAECGGDCSHCNGGKDEVKKKNRKQQQLKDETKQFWLSEKIILFSFFFFFVVVWKTFFGCFDDDGCICSLLHDMLIFCLFFLFFLLVQLLLLVAGCWLSLIIFSAVCSRFGCLIIITIKQKKDEIILHRCVLFLVLFLMFFFLLISWLICLFYFIFFFWFVLSWSNKIILVLWKWLTGAECGSFCVVNTDCASSDHFFVQHRSHILVIFDLLIVIQAWS